MCSFIFRHKLLFLLGRRNYLVDKIPTAVRLRLRSHESSHPPIAPSEKAIILAMRTNHNAPARYPRMAGCTAPSLLPINYN